MREDYSLYKTIAEIKDTISQDVESKIDAEIEKRIFKAKTVIVCLATLLAIFGIGTAYALPKIAANTAKEIVKEETSLQVLGELKRKEIEISAAHTNAMQYIDNLSNDYEEFSSKLAVRLKSDSEFSSKITEDLKDDPAFIAAAKGPKGDRGDTGKTGEPGPTTFDGDLIYGSVNAGGQVQAGEKYTVTRIDGGLYKILFKEPFASPPSIFLSAESGNGLKDGAIISIRHKTKTQRSFEVSITYGENNKLLDSNWQFIAIGQ